MVLGNKPRRPKSYLLEVGILAVVVLLLAAGSYERNNLWNDEIALWIDCVKKSPLKDRVNANLGYAYLSAGDYDRALGWTEKALEINPRLAPAYLNLSVIFQKRGDLKKAIAMGEKTLEVDPTLYMARYSLASLYFENGQFEEAVKAYQSFLLVYPHFPDAHQFLALAYAAQRRFDKAVTEFEKEIRINPSHALAHLNLGQLYWYEFQQKAKALYHLRAALMLDPLLPNRTQVRRLVQSLERSPL